ncbi:hypothetical protein NEMBOFW57_008508 [Staphylotrichum longicolle]|uniref:Uncharacterized protein n=1 Tax=Staphylotrichum longicolle TaxID=669026 RepID=A0AAD4HVX3_9PEZI|nr:hypothetical protein NEMBOFW57_008508 [Staphylotrichum longicolle]
MLQISNLTLPEKGMKKEKKKKKSPPPRNWKTTLARSNIVPSRPYVSAPTHRIASTSAEPRIPYTSTETLDVIRNHSVLGEDSDQEVDADYEEDTDPAEQCPRILIDAIERRLCAVQIGAAAAFGRTREEAGLVEELETSATWGKSITKPYESCAQPTPRETDVQLQILEDENRMLRECLIGWANQSSQASERVEGPSMRPSTAFGPDVLIEKLRESERQRSILKHRVKELEKIQNQDGHIFEMLLSADPVHDGTPDCKPIIRHIRRELEEHRMLGEVIGPALTVRGVLALKAIQHQRTQLQNKFQAGSDLDTILSLQEAIDLASQLDSSPHLLDPDSTNIQSCSRCKIPRFLRLPPISSTPSQQQHPSLPPQALLSPIPLTVPRSEFNCSPSGQPPGCCRQLICDACASPAAVAVVAPASSSQDSDRDRDRADHGDRRRGSCPAPNCTSPPSPGTVPMCPVPPPTTTAQLASTTILRSCRDPGVVADCPAHGLDHHYNDHKWWRQQRGVRCGRGRGVEEIVQEYAEN